MQVTGGCQCGAVRYVADAESNEAYSCHCRMCQKAFGNVFAALFSVKKSAAYGAGSRPGPVAHA